MIRAKKFQFVFFNNETIHEFNEYKLKAQCLKNRCSLLLDFNPKVFKNVNTTPTSVFFVSSNNILKTTLKHFYQLKEALLLYVENRTVRVVTTNDEEAKLFLKEEKKKAIAIKSSHIKKKGQQYLMSTKKELSSKEVLIIEINENLGVYITKHSQNNLYNIQSKKGVMFVSTTLFNQRIRSHCKKDFASLVESFFYSQKNCLKKSFQIDSSKTHNLENIYSKIVAPFVHNIKHTYGIEIDRLGVYHISCFFMISSISVIPKVK